MTYQSDILALSPVLYWRLEESTGATTAVDSSPNGRDGTITNTPTFGVAGKVGNAYTFTNINQLISLAITASPNADFTYIAWVKRSANPNTFCNVAGRWGGSAFASIARLGMGSDGKAWFGVQGSTTTYGVGGSTSLSDGAWHMLVGVYTHATARVELFVDGVSQGFTTRVNAFNLDNAPWTVAARSTTSGDSFASGSNGSIDEVAWIPSALSSAQINSLYSSASAPPSLDVIAETETVYPVTVYVDPALPVIAETETVYRIGSALQLESLAETETVYDVAAVVALPTLLEAETLLSPGIGKGVGLLTETETTYAPASGSPVGLIVETETVPAAMALVGGVQPGSGQINVAQYRYTPVSVNVGYEHGSIESFEYHRATVNPGDATTDAGVPKPVNDQRRP